LVVVAVFTLPKENGRYCIGVLFCCLLLVPIRIQAQTYNPADVAVISALIANNGLKAVPGALETWDFAVWNNTVPKQIVEIRLINKSINGAVSFSGLTRLRLLDCYNNSLTELDVSNCTQLTTLQCDNNILSNLDVTNCTQLQRLWCNDNKLTELDVTQCTQLTSLLCYNNNLTVLDVTKCTLLQALRCDNTVFVARTASEIAKVDALKRERTEQMKRNTNTDVITSASINAQDVIILKNGQEIHAKVTEITLSEIKYKQFEHLDGPTRTVSKNDVFVIIYENGIREVFSPTTANTGTARQGDFAVGGNLIYGTGGSFSHVGIGGKFFYNATKSVRLAGEFDFFPKKDDISGWDFSVYGHYLFSIGEKVALYPSVGIGMVGYKFDFDFGFLGSHSESINKFAYSLGGGIDFALSSNLALNIELRRKMIAVENLGYRTNLAVGLAYKF